MNPRFVAFLMLNNGKQWKSKQARNASYICFIIDMKVKYLGSIDGHITDQSEFTRFIESHVTEAINGETQLPLIFSD